MDKARCASTGKFAVPGPLVKENRDGSHRLLTYVAYAFPGAFAYRNTKRKAPGRLFAFKGFERVSCILGQGKAARRRSSR